MPSSSHALLANKTAAQSFSDMLEQTQPYPSQPSGTQPGLRQGLVRRDSSPVGVPPKHEAKIADSKLSDSEGRDLAESGNAASHTSLSRAGRPDETIAVIVVPPPVTPALRWNAGVRDFTPDARPPSTALNDSGTSTSTSKADTAPKLAAVALQSELSPALPWNRGISSSTFDTLFAGAIPNRKATPLTVSEADSTAKPEATAGTTLRPKLTEYAVLTTSETGLTTQDSATLGTAHTNDAGNWASPITNASPAIATDSPKQPGDTPVSLRNASHGPVGVDDGVNSAKSVIASGPQPVVAPSSTLPPAPVILIPTPDAGKMDFSSSQGTRDKPATDRSRVGGTQEGQATVRKNAEVTGDTKSQPRKDDASPSASSPTAGQSTDGAPLKANELSPSFSVAAAQSSPIDGDGRNTSDTVSPHPSDPESGQMGRNLSGAAETSTHAETAANYPTSVVHSAKLIEHVGEAGLRLGIRAGEFGSVDIRTSMIHNQFTAEITVERGELGRVMTQELHSLQSRLTEQGVQGANITVRNDIGGQSTASEQQRPQDGRQMYGTNSLRGREEGQTPALVAFDGTAPSSRLDIHM